MTTEARKAAIRRLYEEVWNHGDLAVIDALFADDYRAPMADGPLGPEGERRHVEMLRSAFPDLRMTIEEMVAEGETIAVRTKMTATDSGGFMGRPPSGKPFTIWGVEFFRFGGDRIVTSWVGVDMLGLFIQLGVVPSPW